MAKRDPNEHFPNRLRELRKEKDWSLQHVADITGISFPNIGKIETGERPMKTWHMEAFARAYGVTQADLFNPEDGGLSPDERALIDTYRDLPAALKKTFDALRDSHQHLRGTGEIIPIDRDGDDRKRA